MVGCCCYILRHAAIDRDHLFLSELVLVPPRRPEARHPLPMSCWAPSAFAQGQARQALRQLTASPVCQLPDPAGVCRADARIQGHGAGTRCGRYARQRTPLFFIAGCARAPDGGSRKRCFHHRSQALAGSWRDHALGAAPCVKIENRQEMLCF